MNTNVKNAVEDVVSIELHEQVYTEVPKTLHADYDFQRLYSQYIESTSTEKIVEAVHRDKKKATETLESFLLKIAKHFFICGMKQFGMDVYEMNEVNNYTVVRKIDFLGRIMIPLDLRRKLRLGANDNLFIGIKNGTLFMREFSDVCPHCFDETYDLGDQCVKCITYSDN